METPLVSIIVPLFNQGQYIREAIESVLNQTYSNWEIIVMDDGSSDGGGDIVREIAQNNPKIFLFCQQNSGPSISRNQCILRSKGKYILPLDGDDKIASTYLEKAVEYLESHPDCKLVYCRAEKFGAEIGPWNLKDYYYEDLLWENLIFCTAMFRREDYDKTSGYNSNMNYGLEDWDFWLSLLSPEDKVHRINEVLFYYRIKKISRSTELSSKYFSATKQIYENHQELYSGIDVIAMHQKQVESEKRLQMVLESKTYKIGQIIMAPIKMLNKIFNNEPRQNH